MKKILAVALGVILLAGCAEFSKEDQKQIEAVDGMVYSFIVGKVEGNDDLLGQVLASNARGILQPGRHAYPGAAEEMGDRYEIKRYHHNYHQGLLVYRTKFFRPSTGKMDHYNVIVQNGENGWRVANNGSGHDSFMRRATVGPDGKKVEPVVVHEWEGRETE